jgi:hypothetical protein
MEWGVGAKEVYATFGLKMDALEEIDPQRHQLALRCAENAQRLATNLTLGCYSGVVDVRTMEWATQLMELSLEEMVEGVAEHMGDDFFAFPKLCLKVVAKIREGGGWRATADLRLDFQNNMRAGYEVDNALKHLKLSGQIALDERRIGSRGPTTSGYVVLEREPEAQDDED